MMLDQYADEAFEASKDRAMEHDRPVPLAILADIGGVEPVGQDRVRLHRADLPGAADRVGQMEFELRRVEGAFTRQFLPAELRRVAARRGDRVAQRLFGPVPHLVAAEALLGPQRQLDRIIGEAEILVDPVEQVAEHPNLLDDLVRAAEDMGIVLRELTHAQDAVQRAVRFVAVAAAEFGEAQGEIAIGFDPLPEDQDVRRAVHRLQRHPVRIVGDDRPFILRVRHLVGDDEHILAIFAPVAGLLPLARVHYLGRLHLLIGRVQPAAHIGFQLAPDHIALRMPEDRAVRLLLEVEQVHLLPDLAMVALLRLFEPHEIGVELLPVQPARAIDARELRIVLVAAPIGAGDARQFEGVRIELARRGEVRAAAHVHPVVTRPVDRQFLALRQFGSPFGLERLALIPPALEELIARPDFPLQRLVRADDAPHLLLDPRQVLFRERAAFGRRGEVIVKAVVRRRAEGDLRAGKEALHRLGEDMGEIVPRQLQRIRLVARRDQSQFAVALERPADIAQLAIHARRDRCLGEARPDRRRDIGRRRARRDFADRSVGQSDRKHVHFRSCSSARLCTARRPRKRQERERDAGSPVPGRATGGVSL